MKKLITTICCVLALTLCLTACGQSAAPANEGLSLAKGGTLVLSVNPEIAVEYDEYGRVTGVTARNNDALAIINSCTNLIGQPTREVVTDLVTAIGEAGYFVEEIEGERRQITLEIESGSSLPNNDFLDDVISDIRDVVSKHDWSTPLVVEGESDFGISDYIDTDYGINSDGVTDFFDNDSNYDSTSDYNDSVYGNDTNYGDSIYEPTSNYGDSVYEPTSNYGDSIYDPASNYGDSIYDPASNYGDSVYEPASNYGDSVYEPESNYDVPSYGSDSGYSDYSGYGES